MRAHSSLSGRGVFLDRGRGARTWILPEERLWQTALHISIHGLNVGRKVLCSIVTADQRPSRHAPKRAYVWAPRKPSTAPADRKLLVSCLTADFACGSHHGGQGPTLHLSGFGSYPADEDVMHERARTALDVGSCLISFPLRRRQLTVLPFPREELLR